MSLTLTKRELRDRLGLKSDAALAAYFPVTRAAVAQWGEEEPVPVRRLMEAVIRNPEAFPEFGVGVTAANDANASTQQAGVV